MTWASYALVALGFADQTASQCHKFGDLVAECSAPIFAFIFIMSAVFFAATLALTYVAMRTPKGSDES
jgi:preprotein translocase subunit SecG